MQHLIEEVDCYTRHLVFGNDSGSYLYILIYLYIMCACVYMLFVQVVLQAGASSESFIRYLNIDIRDVNVRKLTIHRQFTVFQSGNLAGLEGSLPVLMATLQNSLLFWVVMMQEAHICLRTLGFRGITRSKIDSTLAANAGR